MADTMVPRTDSVPSLTASRNWKRYVAGMGTEALFILALTGLGFILALVAKTVWR